MTRWHGMIGYAKQMETSPGVWTEKIIEMPFNGDLARVSKNNQSGSNQNVDIVLSNTISIVSYLFDDIDLSTLRYVTLGGARWSITSIDMSSPPRFVLTTGGVYNGPTP